MMTVVHKHKAVIELEIHQWDRERAASILEEIVRKVEKQATNDAGGVSLHHRVLRVALETIYEEVEAV